MKTKENIKAVYSEETEMKNNTAMPTENRDNKGGMWRSVLMGGIPGIVLGVLGDEAVEEAVAQDHNAVDPIVTPVELPEVHVATSVNDEMSFNEAFAAARAEVGPGGAFSWHGQVYSTYRADDPEWQNMSEDQRSEHSSNIISQVHPQPYSHHNSDVADIHGDIAPNPEVDPSDHGEIDVHIVAVDQETLPDGSEVNVGLGQFNGMNAQFYDSDGDGEVDTIIVDRDNNGEADMYIEDHHLGITVEGMVGDAIINTASTIDDNLYNNMPDYTNDADVHSLA